MRPVTSHQKGAVLLLTLLMVAMVAALISTTLWRQSGQIQIETAQRQRQQGLWLLQGATDWARLILREDARNGSSDHLSEPWAVPLKESRLSSFLSNQPNLNTSAQEAAWADRVLLSGGIQDAQGKFNLANLVQGQAIDRTTLGAWKKLFGLLGLSPALADQWAQNLVLAKSSRAPLLWPQRIEDLRAWGGDEMTLSRLRPHVTVLPERTALNVNTATPEVLAASIDGLDLVRAQRLVEDRQRTPWTQPGQARQALGPGYDESRHGIGSVYFVIQGALRMGEQTMAQTALVKRDGTSVSYVWVNADSATLAP